MSLSANANSFIPLSTVTLNYGRNTNVSRNANWRKGRALAKKNRQHMERANRNRMVEGNAGNAVANAMFAPNNSRKTRKQRKARRSSRSKAE